MKVVVAAFNQEKALVAAFSVIVKTGCGTDGSFYSTNVKRVAQLDDILSKLSMENIKIELLFVFSPLAAIGLNCNP